MAVLAVLTGCADREEPTAVVGDSPVAVSLAFSMPAVSDASDSRTRMTDEVVQTTPEKYRGLKDVRIIPFTVPRTIISTDAPHIMAASGDGDDGRVANSNVTNAAFYYYPSCHFWSRTASVLFYGRGANGVKVDGNIIPADNKAFYGSTSALNSNDPAAIRFNPEKIRTLTTPDTRAQALADYLTAIAKTQGWATTDDAKLKALYLNFIHRDDHGNFAVIAGSSANIRAFVEELYTEVALLESDEALAERIRTSIKAGADVVENQDGKVTSLTLKNNLTGYPANLGLPDGAAGLKWAKPEGKNDFEFVPQTQTTTEASITAIDRFVYPAELCYYGNSTIRTSVMEVAESVYENAENWSEVLNRYQSGTEVNGNTRSAAMVSPAQYGVARLSVRLDMVKDILKDALGDEVDFDNTYYPLTAVIVGGQYPVGFDFRPETVTPWPTNETEATEMSDQMLFVYDSQVKTAANNTYYYLNDASESGNTNTLLLQSYEGQSVKIVLEFENKSNKKFMGHDGIVYPGTKFYLLGDANLNNKESDNLNTENRDRVFTQDYTTTFKMQVKSFKNAYNVMPDLLTPRMEIGVEVADWETIRPTVVELQQ